MRASILIVDDSGVDRRILRAILEDGGYAVREATSAEDGIAQARLDPPDAILLDVIMPGANGYEACEALKSDATTTGIPVLFVSSLIEPRARVKGLDAGGEDFVTKPYDAGEILARLRARLRTSRTVGAFRAAADALHEENARVGADLRNAADIQRANLPRPGLRTPGLACAWRYRPCAAIGGGAFGLVPLGDDASAAFIVDVEGHGAAAALVAAAVSQSLVPGSPTLGGGTPATVLERLAREFPPERFGAVVTAFALHVDAPTGRLRYASAAHPPPLLVKRDGTIEELVASGPAIGASHEPRFSEGRTRLDAGDRLILYTGGLLDRAAPGAAPFGVARLRRAVLGAHLGSLEELCDAILDAADAWAGESPARDDVTLVVLEAAP